MDSIGSEARPDAGDEAPEGTRLLPGGDRTGDTDTALLVSGQEISWAG